MPALPFLIQGHSLSWSCATLKCPGACLSLAETTWWNHCNIPPGTPLPGTGTSEFHPGQLITPFRSKAVAIYKANVFVKGLSNYFSPDPALTIAGLRSCLCLDIRESCGDGGSELFSCPACFFHVLELQVCTFWVTMFLFCFDHTTRFPLYYRVLVVRIICTSLVLKHLYFRFSSGHC